MIDELVAAIAVKNPRQRRPVEVALSTLQEQERRDLAAWVRHAVSRGGSATSLAAAYDLVVRDTLREQVYFRRHGHYRHASFADVASDVYFSPTYMQQYMEGLALTGFFWENHVVLRRFLLHALARLPRVRRYLEVGPGHGLHLAAAARLDCADSFEAIDLSPTSVALCRDLLASGALGALPVVQVREADFLGAEVDGPFGIVVMGEVLEHVERPELFLGRARALLEDGGHLLCTTCIDAPAIDHIRHFRSVEEVEDLIFDAGLDVLERCVLPHPGLSLAEAAAQRLAVNVGFVARARPRA